MHTIYTVSVIYFLQVKHVLDATHLFKQNALVPVNWIAITEESTSPASWLSDNSICTMSSQVSQWWVIVVHQCRPNTKTYRRSSLRPKRLGGPHREEERGRGLLKGLTWGEMLCRCCTTSSCCQKKKKMDQSSANFYIICFHLSGDNLCSFLNYYLYWLNNGVSGLCFTSEQERFFFFD